MFYFFILLGRRKNNISRFDLWIITHNLRFSRYFLRIYIEIRWFCFSLLLIWWNMVEVYARAHHIYCDFCYYVKCSFCTTTKLHTLFVLLPHLFSSLSFPIKNLEKITVLLAHSWKSTAAATTSWTSPSTSFVRKTDAARTMNKVVLR